MAQPALPLSRLPVDDRNLIDPSVKKAAPQPAVDERVKESVKKKMPTSMGKGLEGVGKSHKSASSPLEMQKQVERARIEKLASVFHIKLTGEDRGTVLPDKGVNDVKQQKSKEIIDETIKEYKECLRKELLKLDPEAPANIEKAQKLAASITNCDDPASDEYRAVSKFVNGVIGLGRKIEGLNSSRKYGVVDVGSIDGIRKEMSELMGLPVYMALIDSDLAAVNFLQFLSIKLHSTDGEPILSEYARKELDDPLKAGGEYSMRQLGHATGSRLKEQAQFNQDSISSKIWFWLNNPSRAAQSYKSNKKPLEYNPNDNNPSYLGPQLKRDGKTMQAYYGPAPTGDRVFEYGLLPAYKKLGIFEVYFNYQDTSHAPEKARIQEIQRIADKPGNQDVLKHAVIGFDAKIKQPEMKKLLKTFKSVEEFINGYQPFVMDGVRNLDSGTGFCIPKELLSEEQLRGIFDSSKKFFEKMGIDDKLKDPKINKADLAEMMVLDIDARIAAAILHQQFNRVPDRQKPGMDKDLTNCFVSARCKQHIDRGAVQSSTLRLYFRMFEDDSYLSKQEFEEISGGILGRAVNVDNRNILFHRYKRFESLMSLIGDNHAELARSLRDYRDTFLLRPLA